MKDYQKFITFVVFYSILFNQIDAKIPNGWGVVKSLFSGSASATILFVLFKFWDKFLWRVKNRLVAGAGYLVGFYNYHDLMGEWKAEYASSYNSDPKTGEYRTFGKGLATIKQTYTKINLDINWSNSSNSESFMVELKQKENNNWILVAAYTNTPKDPKLQNSPGGQKHDGFCHLTYDKKKNQLIGFYSNDENRKTRGRLILKRN